MTWMHLRSARLPWPGSLGNPNVCDACPRAIRTETAGQDLAVVLVPDAAHQRQCCWQAGHVVDQYFGPGGIISG